MTLIEQLHQLTALAAQATAGPWKDHAILLEPAALLKLTENNDQAAVGRAIDMPNGPRNAVALCGPLHDKESRMTAAFITAARNVLTPQNLALLVDALAPQWVAAADRLPEPTMEGDVAVWELALIVRESSSIVHVGYYNRYDTKWVSIWGLERIDDVTHWMPLPAKPATMEGGRLDA